MPRHDSPAMSAGISPKDPVYQLLTREELIMLFQLGDLAMEHGELSKAEKIFEAIRALRSNNAGGYMGLSKVYFSQGRIDDAVQLLQSATALEGEQHDLGQACLGSLLLQAGRPREAARALRAVVDSGRQNNGVAFARGILETEVDTALRGEQLAGGAPRTTGR